MPIHKCKAVIGAIQRDDDTKAATVHLSVVTDGGVYVGTFSTVIRKGHEALTLGDVLDVSVRLPMPPEPPAPDIDAATPEA